METFASDLTVNKEVLLRQLMHPGYAVRSQRPLNIFIQTSNLKKEDTSNHDIKVLNRSTHTLSS